MVDGFDNLLTLAILVLAALVALIVLVVVLIRSGRVPQLPDGGHQKPPDPKA